MLPIGSSVLLNPTQEDKIEFILDVIDPLRKIEHAKSQRLYGNTDTYPYDRYQFDWMGVPIIQMPGDLVMFQEIVWKTRPDLIIETGVARGGSLIFWASMQKLCGIDGKVLGVDIDIREHAKRAISGSQFNQQIELRQGSSTDLDVFEKVKAFAQSRT